VRELSESEGKHREELVQLLTEHEGNLSAVAKVLGKGRTRIVRWVKRYRIDVELLRP